MSKSPATGLPQFSAVFLSNGIKWSKIEISGGKIGWEIKGFSCL